MRQPHRNHLNYVACSAVSILVMRYDHPRYADDAEVAPRLEPTSKCMNKIFWCVLLILSKLQAFLWGGGSLAFFFGTILLKIEGKVENHWSHSAIIILGFVLYKYQLSAVLNNTTINYRMVR